MPSQEPTLPPIIYSSPADDVIERRDARRPAEQLNAQNERNVYDLVMTGIAEPGLRILNCMRMYLDIFTAA